MPTPSSRDFAHPVVKTGVCATIALTTPLYVTGAVLKVYGMDPTVCVPCAVVSVTGVGCLVNRPLLGELGRAVTSVLCSWGKVQQRRRLHKG